MRAFSLIEILFVICIVGICASLVVVATSDYRKVQAISRDARLREVAIDQLYEQHALSADEIWLASARAELARRGLTGPTPLNRQTLAVYVDSTGPYEPAFVVPNRYDPQTLHALGLDEPVLNR
jgi:prepilin-type N-terminal cleavage/methylation domain-containing protein